jgi:uncharacterized protein (DUF2235 family)
MTNIVICFDGTGGEIRAHGNSNVVQLVRRLQNEPGKQLTYYDPGVGTFSAAGAWTEPAQRISRLFGAAFGAGMRTNLEEAYTFLINHWQRGDKIFIFGFSRGAYCARALTGMLDLIGITRPGSENLVKYAIGNYARRNPKWRKDDWIQAKQFASVISQDVDGHYWVPVTYLGLWDTVKAPGILRRSMEWPYTRELRRVGAGRHAVSIDEKRRPFREYLVDESHPNIQEVWFAGVHSDIGGGFVEEPRLGDIALKWVTDGARVAGILLREDRLFEPVTIEHATAAIHRARWIWSLLIFRRRRVPPTAKIHASVKERMAQDPRYQQPCCRCCKKRVPTDSWADLDWLTQQGDPSARPEQPRPAHRTP